MGAYILKRILLMIPTLLGIMLMTFTVIQFVPCSLGPPGTNWMTVKVISIMPSSVGIISNMRFRI